MVFSFFFSLLGKRFILLLLQPPVVKNVSPTFLLTASKILSWFPANHGDKAVGIYLYNPFFIIPTPSNVPACHPFVSVPLFP
jgi:hypothetical protein